MKTRIIGTAVRLVKSLNQSTLADLIRLLKIRHGYAEALEETKSELKARRQREGESLRSLHADIRKLLADSYPEQSGPVLEDLGKDIFLNATGHKLRNKVRDN